MTNDEISKQLMQRLEEWRANRELNSRAVKLLCDVLETPGAPPMISTVVAALKGCDREANFSLEALGDIIDSLSSVLPKEG